MNTDVIMSFLAVLLTGYALISEEERLAFKIRISWFEYAILFSVFLIPLGFIYKGVFKYFFMGKVTKPIVFPYGLNEESIACFYLLFILLILFDSMRRNYLSNTSLKKWFFISGKLMLENKLTQLGYLFDKYHQQLAELITTKIWHDEKQNREKNWPGKIGHSMRKFLSFSEQKYNRTLCNEVSDNTARLLRSENFVTHLVTVYPSVAAKFSVILFDEQLEYNKLLFTELMENRHSHLYQELKNNTSGSDWNRYLIDPSNILLHFYFADINNAIRAQVWKPVGDYALTYIEQQTGSTNFYNQAYTSSFGDKGCWQCPIFIAITFFKIMILERLYQHATIEGETVHLWPSYILHFITAILDKLELTANDAMNATPFHTLLYHCVETSAKWIEALIEIHKTDTTFITSNTAKHISQLFGVIIHEIIASDKLLLEQKREFLQTALCKIDHLDLQLNDVSSLVVDHIFFGEKKYSWEEYPTDYTVDLAFAEKLKTVYELRNKPAFHGKAPTFVNKYKDKITLTSKTLT